MFCGTSSFRDLAGDNAAAPKTSRKKKKRQSKSKNPYSSRGLDKFTSVLSDLEARREKIMATTGAQGISMIRFMYSNSQDWIPIIVRLRDDGNFSSNNNNINNNINNNSQLISAASSPKVLEKAATAAPPVPAPAAPATKKLPWWRWRSAYCVPVMAVMLLVCLVIFGRVFAICCTSIWWYLVPVLQGEDSKKTRRRVSRKEYVKKMSDKRLQPPPPPPAAAAAQATGTGLQMLASPRAHGNNGKKG